MSLAIPVPFGSVVANSGSKRHEPKNEFKLGPRTHRPGLLLRSEGSLPDQLTASGLRMKADLRSEAQFAATHWSMILAAQDAASPDAEAALARLCEAYWYPIYAFLRRKGHSCHEAEDLTQSFFAHVLRREWLRNVGPEKGRFRTFVLRCLTNFVASQPRLPRMVPIDFTDAEARYGAEPVDNATPARIFELQWAATLLGRAHTRLQEEYAAAGNAARFAALVPYLTKETAPGAFAEVAARLGLSAEAARQETSRMRKRFSDAIRGELAETVSGREEVEAELHHLMDILSQ